MEEGCIEGLLTADARPALKPDNSFSLYKTETIPTSVSIRRALSARSKCGSNCDGAQFRRTYVALLFSSLL
jgi:hypothetical protein